MKKYFSLFLASGVLFLGLNSLLYAQKHLDLQLSILSPEPGAVIPYGDTAYLICSVKNLGPETIDSATSPIYISTLNSAPFPSVLYPTLAPGDSAERLILFAWSTDARDEDMNFCFYLNQPLMNGIIDSNSANDTACIYFTLQGSNNHTAIVEAGAEFSEGFQLFPNPAHQSVWLRFYSAEAEQVQLQIVDALGRIVVRKDLAVSAGRQDKTIDISQLVPGFYFVKLFDGRTSTVEKLYVE